MMFCMENRLMTDQVEINPHTVVGKLKEIWTAQPDREAIAFYDDDFVRTSITNKKLEELCVRMSSLLQYHGVKKGDVVCNLLNAGIEREVINFGVILAGGVIMHGMDVDDKDDRVFWRPMNQANVKYIVVEPHIEALGWKILRKEIGGSDVLAERYTGKQSKDLQKIFVFRREHRVYHNLREIKLKPALQLLQNHNGSWIELIYAHDPCSILVERCPYQRHYKMVLRSHRELIEMAERNAELIGFHRNDIIYNDFPLAWLTGLPFSYFIRGCAMVKSTLIECPAKKVVRETWALIEREKCTIASLPPSMIQMLASHCEDLPVPHWTLRAITSTYQVTDTVLDAIGPVTASIIICYTRVEGGLVSRLVLTEDNMSTYRNGCVGDTLSTVRTKLDLDANNTPEPNQMGEILLKGRLISRSYYNDPTLTKCSYTQDDCLLTGDLGFYDEKQRMYVLGRKGDALIRGKIAIFPEDIEQKVNQCPGIWKVKVVSVRDPEGYLQMCACVVPRSVDATTIDRVKEYCRYQLGGIPDHDEDAHMPTYVFFFDSFPMISGQVNRPLLAQMASDIVSKENRTDK